MGPFVLNFELPATVGLAALATVGYLASRAKRRGKDFTSLDALILTVVVAVMVGTGIPLLEAANRRAQASALLENLHTLRAKIALYVQEHAGLPPLARQNTLPQLLQPTNAAGIIGPRGSKYPFGPYLFGGVPVNPLTGRSVVTPTDTFPPSAPSGGGGWIYHQATGQIAADVGGCLDQ
jgi:type II secretory pathway pseudopilin PulG